MDMRMFRWFVVFFLALFLSACAGSSEDKAPVLQMVQKKDKTLSCKEVLLEMNEADFYRKMAHKNQGPKLKYVLMPLGYISTYMGSEEAIAAADARVAYLEKIYDILACDKQVVPAVSGSYEHGSVSPAAVEQPLVGAVLAPSPYPAPAAVVPSVVSPVVQLQPSVPPSSYVSPAAPVASPGYSLPIPASPPQLLLPPAASATPPMYIEQPNGGVLAR